MVIVRHAYQRTAFLVSWLIELVVLRNSTGSFVEQGLNIDLRLVSLLEFGVISFIEIILVLVKLFVFFLLFFFKFKFVFQLVMIIVHLKLFKLNCLILMLNLGLFRFEINVFFFIVLVDEAHNFIREKS